MHTLDDQIHRSHLAIYYAGQAVVAIDRGIGVGTISLDHGLGLLDSAIWPCAELYTAGDRRARHQVAEGLIVALYAGRAAERAIFRNVIDDIAEHDEETAFRISVEFRVTPRSMVHIGDESHHRCLNGLRRKAHEALQGCLQAVGRLAVALAERGALTDAEINDIIAGGSADAREETVVPKRPWWKLFGCRTAQATSVGGMDVQAFEREKEKDLAEIHQALTRLGEAVFAKEPPALPGNMSG